MGWFSRKPVMCPICGTQVDTKRDDIDGAGHFMRHLDDAPGDASRLHLALACGCPEAVWSVKDDFPTLMMKHLIYQHDVRVPDVRGRDLNAPPEWERPRGRQTFPPTPYGYVPPPEAAVLGWQCTNLECGRGEGGLPDTRSWPGRCPECGSPVGTGAMRDPWAHEAERAELDVRLHRPRDEIDRSIATNSDFKWHYKDALRRGDRKEALAVRRRFHEHALASGHTPESYSPYARIDFVHLALDYGFLDDAATVLTEWFAVAKVDGLESDVAARTDARQLAAMAISFLEHPYSHDHPVRQVIFERLSRHVSDIAEVMTGELLEGFNRVTNLEH